MWQWSFRTFAWLAAAAATVGVFYTAGCWLFGRLLGRKPAA